MPVTSVSFWRSDADTERIVKHLSLAIFVLSVVLIGLHFGMPRSGALTKESAGVLHSTNAGATGGLGIVLALAARLLWSSKWSKWWYVIVGTEVIMMLIGGNRLSVIVTSITVAFLLLLALHRGIAGMFLVIVSLAVAGFISADPSLSLVEKATKEVGIYAKQGQTKTQINSLSGRSEMWRKIWKSYLQSPIIGHGYFVTTKKGRIYVWHEWGNWTAHNVFLQTLATVGATGLVLLITGLLFLFKGTLSGLKFVNGIEPSITLLIVLTTWYFGWGFLNSSFVGPMQPESVVFSALLGIAVGIGSSAHLNAQQQYETSLRRRSCHV